MYIKCIIYIYYIYKFHDPDIQILGTNLGILHPPAPQPPAWVSFKIFTRERYSGVLRNVGVSINGGSPISGWLKATGKSHL